MGDFLVEDDPCARALVNLVSRGNAIIAELLRLKDHVPSVFRSEKKQDSQKYSDVICDFVYFKKSDEFEKKVEHNKQFQELDAEIRTRYLEILRRFFSAFESVHKYATSINQFLEELEDGLYIQQSLQNLFRNGEGKQLLCEMLYIYGVMLLVVDMCIDGTTREKLLVSYYRYSAQRYTGATTFDDVCKLMRSTGFSVIKTPLDYPADYFRRIEINEDFVSVVIGHLRTDDIYNQISAFPNPEHRSIALSSQAAMLFVCLFFSDSILHSQTAKMREIVDRFFPDNWVVNIYMGLTVNLVDIWEPFRAAKLAIGNTLEADNVHFQITNHTTKLKKCLKHTHQWLKKGVLNEEKVSDSVEKIMSLFRDCNVTLRWFVMHTAPSHSIPEVNKRCKQLRDQIVQESQIKQSALFELLLNTAKLELRFKEICKQLINEKQNRWNTWKAECIDHMKELSDAFSGEKPLTRLPKNERLQLWFQKVASEVEPLSSDKIKLSSRKIAQLIQALDEVKGYHDMSSHHHVTEYLLETKKYLLRMVKLLSVKEEVLIELQIIGDLSYAWNLIDNFTALMQDGIKENPSSASKLRAAFLKLSSALETPLLRINQAGSGDLVSVSEYYSQELVNYISRVLHIIPESMFRLMAEIVQLQTAAIKEVPTRLEKDKLNDYAQLDQRMEVARLTHAVSVLSEGILKMKSTLVGVVHINPKQLLEDGIRRELMKHIGNALHVNLVFNTKAKGSELTQKLKSLSEIMDGYKRSFEYIQDYIDMYGLKIWQEELTRIISYNVEVECAALMKRKPPVLENSYERRDVHIPIFPPTDSQSVNFIGRVTREIIRITDPRTTVYVPGSMGWFDPKSQAEVLNYKAFSVVRNSLGVSGLTGIDKVFGFMIVSKLQAFLEIFEKQVSKDKFWAEQFTSSSSILIPSTKIIQNPQKTYGNYLGKLHKLPSTLLDSILHIGQLQILRQQISYELQITCKFNSKRMYACLETLNEAVLNDVMKRLKDPSSSRNEPKESSVVSELSKYLDWVGIGNPYVKVYITAKRIDHLPVFMFLFVAFQLLKLQWQNNLETMTWKKCGEPLDGIPFIIGVQTLFRQFSSAIRNEFISYFSQYFKSYLMSISNVSSKVDVPPEIQSLLQFLRIFAFYSGISENVMRDSIPDEIFHIFDIINTW